jgi:hypothetical protein
LFKSEMIFDPKFTMSDIIKANDPCNKIKWDPNLQNVFIVK